MQVLQHDQHRLDRCCALEEVAHALEHVVTGLVGGQRQRRRQVRIGDTHLGHEPGDLGPASPIADRNSILGRHGQSVLDGFHEGDVWQRALHVVTMPPDDEHAGYLRLGRDLVDQPRLSKARLSRDERNTSASGHGAGQRLTQQGPFLRPPDVWRASATGRNSGGGKAGNSFGFRTPGDLPQPPSLRETLQLDALVILETEILGGAEDGFQNIGNQDLLSVGLCHNASGGVDAGPKRSLPARIASPVWSPMRTFTGWAGCRPL